MDTALNRRQFVAGTAAALTASAALAGTAAADEAPADSTTPADFATAPEPIADDQIVETVEADVVVLGSGHSGLCAALAAIEAGGEVVVVSASSGPIARGGSNNAVYSKAMEAQGVDPVDIELMARKEFAVNGGAVDQRKWARYFANSEESMNWLIDIMEDAGYETALEIASPYTADEPYYTPSASHCWLTPDNHMAGMTQDYVVQTLAQRIEELGGRIDYSTAGRQLVRGGAANGREGRVEAVIAEHADGTFAKYAARKGVILATGDFSADRQMMERYCPQCADVIDPAVADAPANYDAGFTMGGLYKGDGQKMGLWVGAAWQHNPSCAPMWVSAGSATCKPYCAHWGLKVNANGERFMNEDTPGAFAAFGTASQPGHTAFAIWDDAYADGDNNWLASNTTVGSEPLTTEQIKATWTDSYDTLEEAISALGLPLEETLATIERYNELCDLGRDEDFYKLPAKMKPIRTAPFHTGVEAPMFLTVLGGLRTNANMQVCDEKDQPIPGLYNVGTMVGDFYGNLYTFMMEGWNYGSTCLTFGRLTGRYVMENE